MMTKKYEIVLKYIKDLSVEVPSAETFVLSREYITKYTLGINITTNPLKEGMIEIVTKLNYKDPGELKLIDIENKLAEREIIEGIYQ